MKLTAYRFIIHFVSLCPLLWLLSVIFGQSADLGEDPIKSIQHFLGFTALTLLLITFYLGLFLQLTKLFNYQILRRPLGIWAFFYAFLHGLSYALLELGGDMTLFVSELINRNYLILGLISFVILALMSLSSIPYVKQLLGKAWGRLQKFGYLALMLGSLHYYVSLKNVDQFVGIYLGLTLIVLVIESGRILKNSFKK